MVYLRLVHYTLNPNFIIKTITIKNGYKGDGLYNKPLGGLWCSPLRSKYGWKDWCKQEDYANSLKDHIQIIFKVTRNNILTIDSKEDLNNLPTTAPQVYPKPCIDFEALVKGGTDGIHLTERGVWETKYSYIQDLNLQEPRQSYHLDLNPWDCETVLIMNNKCIKSISTPTYTKVF